MLNFATLLRLEIRRLLLRLLSSSLSSSSSLLFLLLLFLLVIVIVVVVGAECREPAETEEFSVVDCVEEEGG